MSPAWLSNPADLRRCLKPQVRALINDQGKFRYHPNGPGAGRSVAGGRPSVGLCLRLLVGIFG
jgi:hypothetical protein